MPDLAPRSSFAGVAFRTSIGSRRRSRPPRWRRSKDIEEGLRPNLGRNLGGVPKLTVKPSGYQARYARRGSRAPLPVAASDPRRNWRATCSCSRRRPAFLGSVCRPLSILSRVATLTSGSPPRRGENRAPSGASKVREASKITVMIQRSEIARTLELSH
jgi:hypothetical protein